jgi:hypothetical protein
LRADPGLIQQASEVLRAFALEVIQKPRDRLFRDHEARHDPFVKEQVTHEPLEQVMQRPLHTRAGLGIAERGGQPVEGQWQIVSDLLLESRHQSCRQAFQERRPIIEQIGDLPVQPLVDGAVEFLALDGVGHPALDSLADGGASGGGEDFAYGAVGDFVAGPDQEPFHALLEGVGADEFAHAIGDSRGDFRDGTFELVQQAGRKLGPEAPALRAQHREHELAHRAVECFANAGGAELTGEVFRRK